MSVTEPPTDEPRPPRRRLWRRLVRGSLAFFALSLALLVVAAAAIQTGWFKDWLRRYVERSAGRVLNGELSIARLSGDLFTGIRLDDVTLRHDGLAVISVARVDANYSLRDIVGRGLVIDRLVLGRPVIDARQDATGWNLTRLVRTAPGGRRPGRPVEIASLTIYDGTTRVERAGSPATHLTDLDLQMRLSSHPGEIVVDVPHVSFNLPDRALRVGRATGRVTKRGDVVLIERTRVDLPKSHLRVEGAVRDVGTRAQLDLGVASSSFSFPEAGVLVPGIGQIPLTAAFEARVRGPLELIDVALALRSPGGNIDGRVRLALGGASRRIDADTTLTRLDPAPWSGVRALAGSVTGRLRATVPLGGKGLSGTFRLEGPEAAAAGYEARDVVVHGRFDGARVVLEPSTARAYGARVSVSGTIEPTPGAAPGVQYALSGRVADLDLRRLPASLPVPDLVTDLTAEYRCGAGPATSMAAPRSRHRPSKARRSPTGQRAT